MQIAVVADIHGNLPALRAVLAELDAEAVPVDAIVVAGDVVAGPLVREVLAMLDARPEPVHWLSGNSEREALAVWDGGPVGDAPAAAAAAWSAQALDRAWRDRLASWPITLVVEGVRFCHGSPRRDDELLTRGTPDAPLAEALGGVEEALVVGGHTHQQLIRELPGGPAYANAGSVGLPYEGRRGAFWLIVRDGEPELRETAYDVEAAAAELRASGFPGTDDHLGDSLLDPVDADWVTALFEHQAGRRADPGPPRRA